jgi:hypothetical protein
MESLLRTALLRWLQTDPALGGRLNSVTEEAPSRTAPPWLGIVASASADWSTKDRRGREIRVALELHCRGDDPAAATALTEAIEARIEALPRAQPGLEIANTAFLRSRAEQRPANLRAVLLEYRFRVLAA